MKELKIDIGGESSKAYSIWIGSGLLTKITDLFDFSAYSQVLVLSDQNVWKHWGSKVKEAFDCKEILIPSGEEFKNAETLQDIWSKLLSYSADRKTILLNFGGGVVGDIGGFAASTYMRGIDFVQVPTTLLSQVDSSVGGKLGIDYQGVKNLIGVFQQPKAVIIDIDTLSTLPERIFDSGMAENIKHGAIADRELFDKLSQKSFGHDDLDDLIYQSLSIKADIVNRDEKEQGLRKVLNFGHTAGHAFESIFLASDQELLHGEAVALGMVFESLLAKDLGYLSDEDCQLLRETIELYKLPTKLPGNINEEDFLSKILVDKKNINQQVKWTLVKGIGEAVFDCEIPKEQVISTLQCLR